MKLPPLVVLGLVVVCGVTPAASAEGAGLSATAKESHAPLPALQVPSQDVSLPDASEGSVGEQKSLEAARRREWERERERYGRFPREGEGYDWRKASTQHHLDAAAQELLAREGFVMGRREFKQSFEPYISPKGPVFITSDSLLNLYHVLLEESFRDLELSRAPELRRHLEQILASARTEMGKLPFTREEMDASWRLAQLAVGPALVLLGAQPELFDEELRADITSTVLTIRTAGGRSTPRWLAARTPDFQGIDFTRMRPVSFYDQGPLLQDYFRAVRWLQAVPFRRDIDTEFGAALLLRLGQPRDTSYPNLGYLASLSSLVGSPDGPGLDDVPRLSVSGGPKESWQVRLSALRKERSPVPALVREGLQSASMAGIPSSPVTYHLLNASALPETVLFQSLIDSGRRITGLQTAALLGSAEAHRLLAQDERSPLLDEEIQRRQAGNGRSHRHGRDGLYSHYLWTMSALFQKPDPAAPAFMGSPAWEAKSIQTALSSWVQMRHTFALQTKISVATLGAHDMPPGFIEPNPLFLRRFSQLVRLTRDTLSQQGAFEARVQHLVGALQTLVAHCEKLEELARAMPLKALMATAEWEQLRTEGDHLFFQLLDNGMEGEDVQQFRSFTRMLWEGKDLSMLGASTAWLRQLADELASGKRHYSPPRDAYRTHKLPATRWDELERLSLRFETLLQKQLRQEDWNDEDSSLIKGYGSAMAYLMGYFGNHHTPRDDAPRWVQLASFPAKGSLFAAGTGRPTAFYVLYPWKGLSIFCEGAVIPYQEYEGQGILTDDEWTSRLDTPLAPATPHWLRAVKPEAERSEPEFPHRNRPKPPTQD